VERRSKRAKFLSKFHVIDGIQGSPKRSPLDFRIGFLPREDLRKVAKVRFGYPDRLLIAAKSRLEFIRFSVPRLKEIRIDLSRGPHRIHVTRG